MELRYVIWPGKKICTVRGIISVNFDRRYSMILNDESRNMNILLFIKQVNKVKLGINMSHNQKIQLKFINRVYYKIYKKN